jgi:hypothetical protein
MPKRPSWQVLLGHDDPRDTMVYLHLSTRKLKSAPSPLEMFDLAGQTRTAMDFPIFLSLPRRLTPFSAWRERIRFALNKES